MTAQRVLFVNHTSRIAGAEMVLLDVVKAWPDAAAFLFEHGPLNQALERRGLHVLAARSGEGLAGIRRDKGLWRAVPMAWRLAALTLELARVARRHDVVYANSQKAFVVAAAATALCRRPLIWHLHDIIDEAHFGAAQRRMQVTLANRRATCVVVPSQAAAAAFIAAGGRKHLVEVVPNGVDIARDDQSRDVLRDALGLSKRPLIGVFSRLAPWKGQHVVLQALTRLDGVDCVIVGDALFGETDYAELLRGLVRDLGLDSRVRFLGHRSDVPRLMRAVDVMIHPSVDPEPFGRTLVEAMLAGVPVVATDTGAAADILDAGAAGTLVPPGEPDALAYAVARVLGQPEALRAQLQYAASRARTHYSVEAMLTAISGLVSRVSVGARP